MTCTIAQENENTIPANYSFRITQLDFVELIKYLGFMIQFDLIPGLITSKIFNVIN